MKLFAAVISLFFFLTPSVSAFQVDDERLALANRIIELTRATEAIEKIMPTMMDQQMAAMRATGKMDNLTEAQQVALKKAFDDFAAGFTVAMDPLLDEMMVLYAQKFSADDMRGLIEFYESELGQRFVQGGIDLGVEIAAKSQTWAQEHVMPAAQKLSRDIQAALAVSQ